MFMEIIKQRIDDYNDLRNKYYNTELCNEELSSAMNTMVVIIQQMNLNSLRYGVACSSRMKPLLQSQRLE